MLIRLLLCVHLVTSTTGPVYKKVADACDSSPCQNSAKCVPIDQTYNCVCSPGFVGRKCEKKDLCASAICLHGASCTAHGDTATCSCPRGFSGKQCQNVTAEHCSKNPCRNRGTCKIDYTCECPIKFKGPVCADAVRNGTASKLPPKPSSILGLGSNAGKVLMIAVGSMVAISVLLLAFFYLCCYCCEEQLAAIEPMMPALLGQFSRPSSRHTSVGDTAVDMANTIPLIEDKQKGYGATNTDENQADTRPLIEDNQKSDALEEAVQEPPS